MEEKTKVGSFRMFIDARTIMDLTRQAYHMENRQKWAFDTLKTYHGMTETMINNILNGCAILENHPDGIQHIYKEVTDIEWQKKLAEHMEFIESHYYTFGGKKIERKFADEYASQIVKRIRQTLKGGFILNNDPLYLMELERQRQEMHDNILKEAGFTEQEIDDRRHLRKMADEYWKFENDFSKFVDSKAGTYLEDN